FLDMSTSQNLDVVFVSDGLYTGRGFRIYYQHLPCNRRVQAVPICGVTTGKQYFTFSKSEYEDQDTCTYNILQNNTNACGIQWTFSMFELLCGQEYLLIGSRQYCGALTGYFGSEEFQNGKLAIVYRSSGSSNKQKGNFVIRGQQIKDCGTLDVSKVPAQRKISRSDCNIQLSDVEGFASSPRESTMCAYVIHPKPGRCSLEMRFGEFNISSDSQDCTVDYLEIQEHKYCNSQLENRII
ncbi:hypothetical protein L9F63_010217, partial [Diploptera punctata]